MTDKELINALMDAKGCRNQKEAGEILGITQSAISAILSEKANLGGIGRKFIEHLLSDAANEATLDAEKLRRIAAIISE